MSAELRGFVALHPSHVWLLSSEIPDSVSWGHLEAGQDLRGLGFVTNLSVPVFSQRVTRHCVFGFGTLILLRVATDLYLPGPQGSN